MDDPGTYSPEAPRPILFWCAGLFAALSRRSRRMWEVYYVALSSLELLSHKVMHTEHREQRRCIHE